MADLNEVATLFHIHSQALSHGDLFKNIRDAALDRLRAIDAEHAAAKVPAGPYKKSALDEALAGTAAADPPAWAEPESTDTLRRL